ncbi:MAG: type II toxin-antitoxin system HipA family toxin [Spirochaetaceae bacterium]
MSDVVEVRLWGTTIGHLGYSPGQRRIATFEYDDAFGGSGIAVSPIMMPCPPALHRFDELYTRTFSGLPGIFADSLPDKFGNQLIDLYMAEQNIPPDEITALDRLLYVGERGMGALEYHPVADLAGGKGTEVALDIHALAGLADLLTSRSKRKHRELLTAENRSTALRLIRVGSSAGGARSKALVARSPDGSLFDGSTDHGTDYTYWILKFDTETNSDLDAVDPKGMPKVEYIYSLIAEGCGIEMPRTDYLADGEEFHFLVERFDRVADEGRVSKLHYGSWAGLAHADRDPVGTHSYEELILLARRLGLGQDEVTELFQRAVFNVVGRNQDDHTKNFGFLMNKSGAWRLAPAFDMTYSYDPGGKWTRSHQISLNRKQDGFRREDLLALGRHANLTEKKAEAVIQRTIDAFRRFPELAKSYEVQPELAYTVERGMRLDL